LLLYFCAHDQGLAVLLNHFGVPPTIYSVFAADHDFSCKLPSSPTYG
jgi:hypothetical protein